MAKKKSDRHIVVDSVGNRVDVEATLDANYREARMFFMNEWDECFRQIETIHRRLGHIKDETRRAPLLKEEQRIHKRAFALLHAHYREFPDEDPRVSAKRQETARAKRRAALLKSLKEPLVPITLPD